MCESMGHALHTSGQSCYVLRGRFEDSLSQRARGSIILLLWVDRELIYANQELVPVFYMQSSTWVVKTGVSAMHRSRT